MYDVSVYVTIFIRVRNITFSQKTKEKPHGSSVTVALLIAHAQSRQPQTKTWKQGAANLY